MSVQFDHLGSRLPVERAVLEMLQSGLDQVGLLDQDGVTSVSGSPSPRQARATPAS
jgi:hypothetical protein